MFMKKKTAAILKFLVNWPLTWKYLNSNTEEGFFQTLLIKTYSTSLKFHWHPLLFGHSPNRVFRITCFDLKLQKARSTCERKQAKWRKCVPCERLIQGKKHANIQHPNTPQPQLLVYGSTRKIDVLLTEGFFTFKKERSITAHSW